MHGFNQGENKKDQEFFFEKISSPFFGNSTSHIIFKKSKKYIRGSVLDVGAGDGSLIKIIPQSIGIDIAPNGKDVRKGDITNLNFSDDFFDTVFAIEVLEHLNDLELSSALSEVGRVLSRGGIFIITVPYEEKLEESYVRCPECGTKFHKVLHQRSFNENSIRKILELNNFNILKIESIPIGTISRHFLLYYLSIFWKILNIKPTQFFIVAENIKKQNE